MEIKQAKTGQDEQPTMSTASRIDFWQKANELGNNPRSSAMAPVVPDRYMFPGDRQTLSIRRAVPDPHNRFLAIANQAGFLGEAVLIVQLNLFIGRTVPHLSQQEPERGGTCCGPRVSCK